MAFAQVVAEARLFLAVEHHTLDDEALDRQIRNSIQVSDGQSQQFLTSAWKELQQIAAKPPVGYRTDAQLERLRRYRMGLAVAILAKSRREAQLSLKRRLDAMTS
jgi:hypothetical protein